MLGSPGRPVVVALPGPRILFQDLAPESTWSPKRGRSQEMMSLWDSLRIAQIATMLEVAVCVELALHYLTEADAAQLTNLGQA